MFLIALIMRTFIIYVAVGIFVRIMGKRQLGELQPGELVTTILISEIVATPITDGNVPIINGIIPLVLIASFEIITSVITRKSVGFRYLADGKPMTVIRNGKLQQKAMEDLRYNIDDILSALRQKDVFDIEEVEHAVVETNGRLSVLLKRDERPLTPKAQQKPKEDKGAPVTVVVDGIILKHALPDCKITEKDIMVKIEKEKIKLSQVLLMTIDKNNECNIIIKKVF